MEVAMLRPTEIPGLIDMTIGHDDSPICEEGYESFTDLTMGQIKSICAERGITEIVTVTGRHSV